MSLGDCDTKARWNRTARAIGLQADAAGDVFRPRERMRGQAMDIEHDSTHHAAKAHAPAALDTDVDGTSRHHEHSQHRCHTRRVLTRTPSAWCRSARRRGRCRAAITRRSGGARRAACSAWARRALLVRLCACDQAGSADGRAGARPSRGRLACREADRGLLAGRAHASVPARADGAGAGGPGAAARPPIAATRSRAPRVDRRAGERDGARPVRPADRVHRHGLGTDTPTNRHDAGSEDSARAPAGRPACSNHLGSARAGRACIDSEVPR